MKPLARPVRSSAIGTVILAWCACLAARADFPGTVLSQGPVGYWRLNETVQPSPPRPAADIGTLGSAGDGRYLFGPKRGETGALTGSSATSVRFFNPNLDPGFGGSRVEVPFKSTLNPNGPISVELWARPSTGVTDVFCMVASMNSDPAIGVGTNPNPRAGWLFYQNGSGTNASVNQWQFRLGNGHDYLDGDAIPEAYYRKGLALSNLRDLSNARSTWEELLQKYPTHAAATLAKQALERLRRPD